jgi:hypothetical protein
MSKKLTTEKFIEKANKIHGNKYCYANVIYTGSQEPIEIICGLHGSFKQKPNTHLNGRGCYKCGHLWRIKKQSLTTESFIEKAKKIHGDKYEYSLVEYINNKTKVKIICSTHNNFEIKPILKLLLQSEHFFDTLYIGCQIKSPVDQVTGFLRQYEIAFPDAITNTVDAYHLYNNMLNQLVSMGQNPVDPPNVAGWPAYYQSPDYNELWINADTLPKRNKFTDLMLETGYTKNGKKIMVNTINFVKTISTADFLYCLFISTGIPLPSSTTVQLPSVFILTLIFLQ